MAKRPNIVSAITGFPGQLWRFLREARDELRKVSWPSRATTVRYTIVVVVASLAIGGVTGGIDYLLAQILELTI